MPGPSARLTPRLGANKHGSTPSFLGWREIKSRAQNMKIEVKTKSYDFSSDVTSLESAKKSAMRSYDRARTMGRKRCPNGKEYPHSKLKNHCAVCSSCPHGKWKSNCAECNPCLHGKRKYDCAACKSARADPPSSKRIKREPESLPEIKEEPEIKPDPEIEQEPFTIRGYSGIGEQV
jgi:hypothetical protein